MSAILALPILLPLLGAAMSILAGCGSRSQTAHISAEFEPLIPPDTVHLVGVRVEEIRTSPLFKLAVGGPQSATLEKFILETGVDPSRLARQIYDSHSIGRVRLTGAMLNDAVTSFAPRATVATYTLP